MDADREMFSRVISDTTAAYIDQESRIRSVDVAGLAKTLENMGFRDLDISDLSGDQPEEVVEKITERAWEKYEEKIKDVKDRVIPLEKDAALSTFDRAWSNEIDTMDKLRSGIGLRGYAQNNPLQAYVQEGYELFQEMERTIAQEIVAFCLNIRVRSADDREAQEA